MTPTDAIEWLEADGRGGFASGTASGIRTRRYHGLLLVAAQPPCGRMMLANGFDAWVTTAEGRFAISSQRYGPGVIWPDGIGRLASFSRDPWPRWTYRLGESAAVDQEVFVPHGHPLVVVCWRLVFGTAPAGLEVRPFFSGRDYHRTHHENAAIDLRARAGDDGILTWELYPGVPPVRSSANGRFDAAPVWYRNFLYTAELARGLDAVEDLGSPGTITFDLARGEAYWVLGADDVPGREAIGRDVARLRDAERARRAAYGSSLHASADAYVVSRAGGRTIIAGYPWFTDWGRDTFIALPGLCLATGRLDAARDILLEWTDTISEGMVPNRFPDAGEAPEFNSVDASLWFVVTLDRFLAEAARTEFALTGAERQRLDEAVLQIVRGYHDGTRYGIRADDDGLLAAGDTGVALTWMDARVEGGAVTPRVGKPVEVQALWISALATAAARDRAWTPVLRRAEAAFHDRFWNESRGCLYDVVDVNHVRGMVDGSLRPNQIFAVGGLARALVPGDRARAIVDVVERELLTPLGLRTLGPGEPGYVGTYEGGVAARDAAYHQGTAWPWLLYAFADACARVKAPADAARDVRRLLQALEAHLAEAGLGHVSEVTSGDAPFAPGGCPFQAWSLAALLEIRQLERRLQTS